MYDWDPVKAEANARKHGVRFADAVSALDDDLALTMLDPSLGDEERWVTLGMDLTGSLLVVVYTWRADTVRVISARRATRREQNQYGDER